MDQGWEETMDASLTYLLKTSLAKNAKESATLPNSALDMPSEVDSLLKHIQMVLDRLAKGARLIVQ
jgi:Bardet-Biedl syndrome 9 protein